MDVPAPGPALARAGVLTRVVGLNVEQVDATNMPIHIRVRKNLEPIHDDVIVSGFVWPASSMDMRVSGNSRQIWQP